MNRTQKRLLSLMVTLALFVVASAILYMVGMEVLEGKSRTFWDSLEFASETLSTTGYGSDSRWSHPAMVLFVVFLQFIGVFLVFLIVPILLVPYLGERFEQRLPRAALPDMQNHVVLFKHGPALETLQERLAENRVLSVVLESDEETARSLMEAGRTVVFFRSDENVLASCNLDRARALIANGRDEENAALILRARQMGFTKDIYALVEEPVHRKPMELAGATAVYTPRHILAAALAARASDRISPRISGLGQLSGHLAMREIRIQPSSPIAGKTLAEAGITHGAMVTVIAQWAGGQLITDPAPSMRLEPRGILIVVGSDENLDSFAGVVGGATQLRQDGPYLIAGFGEVGRKVHQLLCDAGEDVRVIDREARTGVDLVGNVLDPFVLQAGGVADARSVILALDNDDATLFATVIVQDCAPNAPVIARVNHARNVENIYRAGADFALSLSLVSGQMLSYRLLGERAATVERHLHIVKVDSRVVVGRTLGDLSIRERMGCSVVAVDRDRQTIVDLHPDFRFEPGDALYVCGSDESTKAFSTSAL